MNEDLPPELAHWKPLFDAADREWQELLAKAYKDRPPLKPGERYQIKRVKVGERMVEKEVVVVDEIRLLQKYMEEPILTKPEKDSFAQARRTHALILSPLTRVRTELEQKWGIGRLPSLVTEELAERFGSAQARLERALEGGDATEIRERAEVMRRGWIKLDEVAAAAGHKPWQRPDVWQGQRPDGKTFLVVRTREEATNVNEPGQGVWTLEEIGRVLQKFDKDGFVQSLKDEFGSELTSVGGDAPF